MPLAHSFALFPLLPLVRLKAVADDVDGGYHRYVVVEAAQRNVTCRPDRRTTLTEAISAYSRGRRRNLRMGVVAAALFLWMPPLPATAQDANMSMTVASVGSGTTSLIRLDAVKARPATDRGPAL